MVPATHPQLVSGQSIPVLLIGHFLPETLEAEGHLIGQDGKRQDKIDIDIERRTASRSGGERLMAKLVASGVDPGEYRLIVTVRGEGMEASSSIPVSFFQ